MRKNLIIIVFFFSLCKISFAQDPTIFPPPGSITWCPGEEFDYEVRTTGAYQTACTYKWIVTNGTIFQNKDNEQKVKVKWNDTAGTGTLKITLTNCEEATNTSVSENYAIRSLAEREPANPRKYQSLAYCNEGTIQLAVDVMFMNNTGGTTGVAQQRADGYEWVLPGGWTSGGVGGTIRTQEEFIFITPGSGCSGGSVTVKAFKNCTDRKYSKEATISVARTNPNIKITAPAGYAGPSCGNGGSVTFTVTPLSCATNYGWVFPSGWGLTNPFFTATNSITVTPSGGASDAGPIQVSVNLSCGTVLPSAAYQLVYNPPVITPSGPICTGGTTVNLTNVAPSVYVTWAPSSNMSIVSGQGTSSVVLKAPYAGSLGSGAVNATVNCPGTTVPPKTVWVGAPSQPGRVTGNTTPSVGGIYQYLSSPAQGAASHDWILPYYGDPLWSQSGGNINGTINTLTPNLIVGSSTGYVQVYGINSCGNSGVMRLRVTPSGSGGGGIQQRVGTYPNPTSNEILVDTEVIEEAKESAIVSLMNSDQVVVYTENVKKKNIRIDVSSLPTGTYYLKILLNEKVKQERILIQRN